MITLDSNNKKAKKKCLPRLRCPLEEVALPVHEVGPEPVHVVLHLAHLSVEPLPQRVELAVQHGEVAQTLDGHGRLAALGRHLECDSLTTSDYKKAWDERCRS